MANPSIPTSIAPAGRREAFPWTLAIGLILAVIVFAVAYLIFTQPKAAPATLLFQKIFPTGSGISELEKVDLDIDSVLQNSVFKTLEEHGPLPIQIPAAGKANPFI